MKKFQIEQARRMSDFGMNSAQIYQVLSLDSPLLTITDIEALKLRKGKPTLYQKAIDGDVQSIIRYEMGQR
jgi:hypothetical protein